MRKLIFATVNFAHPLGKVTTGIVNLLLIVLFVALASAIAE